MNMWESLSMQSEWSINDRFCQMFSIINKILWFGCKGSVLYIVVMLLANWLAGIAPLNW